MVSDPPRALDPMAQREIAEETHLMEHALEYLESGRITDALAEKKLAKLVGDSLEFTTRELGPSESEIARAKNLLKNGALKHEHSQHAVVFGLIQRGDATRGEEEEQVEADDLIDAIENGGIRCGMSQVMIIKRVLEGITSIPPSKRAKLILSGNVTDAQPAELLLEGIDDQEYLIEILKSGAPLERGTKVKIAAKMHWVKEALVGRGLTEEEYPGFAARHLELVFDEEAEVFEETRAALIQGIMERIYQIRTAMGEAIENSGKDSEEVERLRSEGDELFAGMDKAFEGRDKMIQALSKYKKPE